MILSIEGLCVTWCVLACSHFSTKWDKTWLSVHGILRGKKGACVPYRDNKLSKRLQVWYLYLAQFMCVIISIWQYCKYSINPWTTHILCMHICCSFVWHYDMFFNSQTYPPRGVKMHDWILFSIISYVLCYCTKWMLTVGTVVGFVLSNTVYFLKGYFFSLMILWHSYS